MSRRIKRIGQSEIKLTLITQDADETSRPRGVVRHGNAATKNLFRLQRRRTRRDASTYTSSLSLTYKFTSLSGARRTGYRLYGIFD